MQEAGVENEMAISIIANIMRGTIANIESTLSPKRSLTGPIQRGDTATIRNHIKSLTNHEQKLLYSTLGHATLELTDHDKEKREAIEQALTLMIKNETTHKST
jgi:predicted short-subunit dehydrogenase-like oxidoreductase (DUF2520 family)